LQSELLPEGGSDADILFQRIDDFFTWIFFFEILLNLAANWFSNFFHDGWSCFDLLVVTVSMIAYFLPGDSSGPMKSIRLLRAFRVMRLFGRLQSLRQIISSLTASIFPVLNAFLVMLLVTSIYSILGVNFFSENFPESFGTFSRALFSMFQVITGDSWATGLARPIMLRTNPDGTIDLGPCFFFISFIVIVGWVLLQVVVAVLLDNFTEASYQEKMRKEQEKLKNENFVQKVHILDPLLAGLAHFDTAEDLTKRIRLLFQVLDSDDSGSLSFQELADGLRKFRVKPRIELSKSDWNAMTLNGSMLNDNQELGLGEFIRMMRSEFKFYVQRQMSNAMDSSNPDKDQKTSAILFVMKLLLVRLDELHNVLDYNPTKAGQDRMGILEEKMDMILDILKNTTQNLLPQTGASNPSRRMEKNAVLEEEIIQRQDSNEKEIPQQKRTEVPAKVEAPAKVRIGRELISCESLSSENSLPASLAGRKRQQLSANADAVLNRNVGEIRKMQDDKKLKKCVIYECWAYKRGEKSGFLQSSAYKKRYFVITDDHRLCYHETKEHYCKGEPRGWLSCDGMLVKERRGTEAIKGRTCFVFTIQAQEGSRTSEIQCACHTSAEREQLLATIESIASITEKRRELEEPGRSWEGLQPERRAKDAEKRENRLQGSDMQSDVQRQKNGGPILNLDGGMPIATQTKSPSLEGSRLLLPRTGTRGPARDLPANAELGYASTAFIGSSNENNAAGTKANPLQDSTAHCL
jgi:voltage-gated sodium channel